MVDDLLEYTGEEDDPFALERYMDPTLPHTLPSAQSSGPATPPLSGQARLTPQMGVTALRMIPEAKTVRQAEEAGTSSPKTHLLDLHHLTRRHKRSSSSGGPGAPDSRAESPVPTPRSSGREGSQSPKGIRLDLHLARRHKRTTSGSPGVSAAGAGESPGPPSRPASARVETGTQSPKANHFIDLHLNRKHKRSSSGGQGMGDPPFTLGTDSPPATDQQHENSPSNSDKKIIFFLKSHNPFSNRPGLNPHNAHTRSRASPVLGNDDDGSMGGSRGSSRASSPSRSNYFRYPGQAQRHSYDLGQPRLPQQQSAPPTPSKVLSHHSGDLATRPARPRSIVADGRSGQEEYWDL
ncbi:hypothetical protein Pcinc_022926 [Petrolisthes cinctipes]|uniref:Uncharacterized protein n=1 Tax=Petrolisthes cinctipes TaxID=88211 RepID=A0AAE1FCT7_PETCI|nr:hypothetical protein Pcinc_031565 [Petrolisthes cinctipes]KAK3871964.1 hypothetical protein Pcinc_022926 [Petrolisthes cinctipes]